MNDFERLKNDSTYLAPKDDDILGRSTALRLSAQHFEETILAAAPPCREVSIALTKLEETFMWAVAAVTRNEAISNRGDL